jgi:hypothetical protein
VRGYLSTRTLYTVYRVRGSCTKIILIIERKSRKRFSIFIYFFYLTVLRAYTCILVSIPRRVCVCVCVCVSIGFVIEESDTEGQALCACACKCVRRARVCALRLPAIREKSMSTTTGSCTTCTHILSRIRMHYIARKISNAAKAPRMCRLRP